MVGCFLRRAYAASPFMSGKKKSYMIRSLSNVKITVHEITQ